MGYLDSGMDRYNNMTTTEAIVASTVVPAVFWVIGYAGWFYCFRGQKRKGLSMSVLCESSLCWPCMWADMSTRSGAVRPARAWSYILIFTVLGFAWGFTDMAVALKGNMYVECDGGALCVDYSTSDKSDKRMYVRSAVDAAFGCLFFVIWVAYAIDRCVVRRFLRVKEDHTLSSEGCCSMDDRVIDFFAGCLFPQAATLQEAIFASDLEEGGKTRPTGGEWPGEDQPEAM